MSNFNTFATIEVGTADGVQTVVIGDVRDIRQDNDVGHPNNQKIHQWVRPKGQFCTVPKGITGGEKPYG
jgi:hypothetical protein